MAFVQKRREEGRDVFYLVSSRHVGSKIQQKVLCYLGPYTTVDHAATSWLATLDRDRQKAELFEERAARHRQGNPLYRRRYWNCQFRHNIITAEQYRERIEETERLLRQLQPYMHYMHQHKPSHMHWDNQSSRQPQA